MRDAIKRFTYSMASILLTDIMLVACCNVAYTVRENVKKAKKREELMERHRNGY